MAAHAVDFERRGLLWMICLATACIVAMPAAFADNIVHRIYLKDASGKSLTAKKKDQGPYSPRETCGQCHDYDTISKGTHQNLHPDKPLGTPGGAPGRDWILTHRESGMQAHTSMGFMPPKKNPTEAGLPPWEFAKNFGGRHVGGGFLNLDRDGKLYSDVMSADDLPDEDVSDYQKAWWDLSGVLEVDCLVCHGGAGYEPVFRAVQIQEAGNFEFAGTQAAGLATVKYSVTGAMEDEDAPLPKLIYNSRMFNDDGTVTLDIGAPSNKRCGFCHDFKPRKAPDRIDETTDIHFTAGLTCIDCHRTGIEHQPSPGYERPNTGNVPPCEGTAPTASKTLTCRGCHTTGRAGAPVALHKGLPQIHLDKIACVGCHSGPAPSLDAKPIEAIADVRWPEMKGNHRTRYRGPIWHMPVFKKDEYGQIRVYQRLLPSYWAVETKDGTLIGLTPDDIAEPIETLAGQIKDDDNDGLPEVNTEAEITATIAAIAKARKGQTIAYLRGGMKYTLADGKLVSTPSAAADPIDWPMGHDVRPAAQAIGAGGCTDCHSLDAPFLFANATVDALSPSGETVTVPMTQLEDQDALFHQAFALSFIFRPVFKITCLACAGIISAILAFYFIAGITRYRKVA